MSLENTFANRRNFIGAALLAGSGTVALAPYSRPAAAHSTGVLRMVAFVRSVSGAASQTAVSAAENQRSLVKELSNEGQVSQEAERLIDDQFQILGQLNQSLLDMDNLLVELSKVVDQDC
ncbi:MULTISPECIES: hypothetical protein [unclassified Roseovarius]|uniref:hypothetical protein n=1 Tax=unclassified Roseovarius TaxID=2614913 RepID=UPI00273DC8EC|nr:MULTISPECIES: hypothetical protein [unclassified Roseovarius]